MTRSPFAGTTSLETFYRSEPAHAEPSRTPNAAPANSSVPRALQEAPTSKGDEVSLITKPCGGFYRCSFTLQSSIQHCGLCMDEWL